MTAPPLGGRCSVDGCEKMARRAGLCGGHDKRKHRRKTVNTPLRRISADEWERLMEAHRRLTDIEDSVVEAQVRQSVWSNAKGAFRKSVYRFMEALNRKRKAEGKPPLGIG